MAVRRGAQHRQDAAEDFLRLAPAVEAQQHRRFLRLANDRAGRPLVQPAGYVDMFQGLGIVPHGMVDLGGHAFQHGFPGGIAGLFHYVQRLEDVAFPFLRPVGGKADAGDGVQGRTDPVRVSAGIVQRIAFLGVLQGVVVVAQPYVGEGEEAQGIGLFGLVRNEGQGLEGEFFRLLVFGAVVEVFARPVPHLLAEPVQRRIRAEDEGLVQEFLVQQRLEEGVGAGGIFLLGKRRQALVKRLCRQGQTRQQQSRNYEYSFNHRQVFAPAKIVN